MSRNIRPPFDAAPEMLPKIVVAWATGDSQIFWNGHYWALADAAGEVSGEPGYWVVYSAPRYVDGQDTHMPYGDWTVQGTYVSQPAVNQIVAAASTSEG